MITLKHVAKFFVGLTALSAARGAPPTEPFKKIPLTFSWQDQVCLKELDIQRVHEKICYDVKQLKTEAKFFFSCMGKNTTKACEKAADVVDRVTQQVLKEINTRASSDKRYTNAYVMLRSYIPNIEYNISRWHTDGYFFKPYQGDASKVVVVFKGAGTLFCAPTHRVRGIFFRHQDAISGVPTLADRKKLQEILKYSRKVQAPQWTGIEFEVGDKNRAAIHSEPPMKEHRIFLSIVPGSAKNLEERKKFDALHEEASTLVKQKK